MTLHDRYTLATLRQALRNPSYFRGELREYGLRANVRIHARTRPPSGTHVPAADWDSLLVLDGCRYDVFRDRNTIEGDLEVRRSLGSQSLEWLRRNFGDGEHHDVVYVSANPHVPRLDPRTFHAVVDLLDRGWDDELETVPPDAVTEAAVDATSAYPEKRLVVHYMQPHYPFIGPKGREIAHRGYAREQEGRTSDEFSVWRALQYGALDASLEEVWRAYRENLDLVLEHVEVLLDRLDGRSVVTSDHGNLLGERLSPIPVRGFGHPRGLRVEELVAVPWLTVDGGGRRPTSSDPPVEREGPTPELLDDRLSALGYRS